MNDGGPDPADPVSIINAETTLAPHVAAVAGDGAPAGGDGPPPAAAAGDGPGGAFGAFRALRIRPFALLWVGQTISRVGDFLYELTLAWWVLQETGSAVAMGTVLAFAFAPMLIFLLIGGVAVDRMHRVRIMIASDLVRGVIVTLVAVLAYADRLELWHVYVLSLSFGLADAFFNPAYFALVPETTPPEHLPSANALSSMSIQLGRIVGPAIAGAIVALGGIGLAFAINGLSFFVSAALLLPLVGRFGGRRAADGEARPGILDDVRTGLATLRGLPILWISIPLIALTNVLLAGPYSVAMPFLVGDVMGAEAGLLGLLYAVFPIGYILGGVWYGRKTRLRRRGRNAYLCLVVAGLGLGVFGLGLPLPVLVVAALLNGAALEVLGIIWTNIFQEVVPNEQMGRVSSVDQVGSMALIPLGFAATGWATERLGADTVFVLGGGLTALLFLVGLSLRTIRTFD